MEYVFQNLGYSKVKLCQFRSAQIFQFLHICKYCKTRSGVPNFERNDNCNDAYRFLSYPHKKINHYTLNDGELKSLSIALSQSLKDQNPKSGGDNKNRSSVLKKLQNPTEVKGNVCMTVNKCSSKLDSCDNRVSIVTPTIHTHNHNLSNIVASKNNKSRLNTQTCTKIGDRFFNEVNIEMLPRSIYQQLFGKLKHVEHSEKNIESVREQLRKHKLFKPLDTSDYDSVEDLNLILPPLEGNDIEEHFLVIGEQQSGPFRRLLEDVVKSDLPPPPVTWIMQEGWTYYSQDGSCGSISCPPDDALVFDVEVCQAEGQLPTLAVALGPQSGTWYGWVSKALANESRHLATHRITPADMVPLENESNSHRIVIGHHVAYDRARCRDQYTLNNSKVRFLDTMSLHISVSGITSMQRAQLRSGKGEEEDWRSLTSLNSLLEVHKLYCSEEPHIDKQSREIFLTGSLNEIRAKFSELMSYCASDVRATFQVLTHLFPIFIQRFPHPVTLAGMLELGTAVLPVDEGWLRYLENADAVYNELDAEARFLLARRAEQACSLLHKKAYASDLWMWDQDWSVKNLTLRSSVTKVKKSENVSEETTNHIRDTNEFGENNTTLEEIDILFNSYTADIEEKFNKLAASTGARLPVKSPHMPGYPNWYRKLCPRFKSPEWAPGPLLISTGMQITPKLLQLTWEKYPLHYVRGHGWGLLVSQNDGNVKPISLEVSSFKNDDNMDNFIETMPSTFDTDVENALCRPAWYRGSGVWCDAEVGSYWFLKLPHKDGAAKNVGNPLARDFLTKLSENVLAGDGVVAERVMHIGRQLSYWRNTRDRVHSQLVVWRKPNAGAIVPQVIVCGTLTRRAVEPTWMTASNVRKDRIGSELRAMIRAPPGYCIVGADVDSQELWIASLLGDAASTGIHGGTPLGWMTLAGTKKSGTDMHSVTAKAIGISRDQAKVLNYARIYGAGSNFAERLLLQYNPKIDARDAARKMFALTKGKRVLQPKPEFYEEIGCHPVSSTVALKWAKKFGRPVSELFYPSKWDGGTESAMFNRLEEIASSLEPKTPFLNGRLSRALEPRDCDSDNRHLPTKINWVVQSGAVDFLHLLLVALRWMLPTSAQFCLSFHDEVRYLVREKDRYKAAVAMHVAHLLARAFCSSRVGLTDLPRSVAFFSSVEVDKVLRKEATDDCTTPSNPFGLFKGYGIQPGESLDIKKALDYCMGKSWWGKSVSMSRATKRKHVIKEVHRDVIKPPTEGQQLVQVTAGRGNNLHLVTPASGEPFLASMPPKFRRNVWIKRGDYVLVEPIHEGDKVKAEIVMIVTQEHKKYYMELGIWPKEFSANDKEGSDCSKSDDDLFMNTNHKKFEFREESSDDSESSDDVGEDSDFSDSINESGSNSEIKSNVHSRS